MSSVAPEPATDDKGVDKRFAVTVIILLLLVAVLAIVYLSGSSSAASAGKSDGGGGGGDDNGDGKGSSDGGGFIINGGPTPPTRMTPPTPRHSTQLVITTSPTPDTFQETTFPPRPVPKTRDPYDDLLLCTVSHRAIFKEMYPPDGYCDLLFYTTAYYEPNSTKFLGAYDEFSFDVFRSQARSLGASSKTGYGVSFLFKSPSDLSYELNTPTGKQKFGELFSDNIYHYGVLHAYGNEYDLEDSTIYSAFQKIKDQQDTLAQGKNGHRVLGFQIVDAFEEYASQQEDIINSLIPTYPITIIVTISHHFKIAHGTTVQGLQGWYSPSTYYDLKDTAIQWGNLASSLSDVRIMASFTMAAAAWTLTSTSSYISDPESFSMSWWNPVINVQSCKDSYSQSATLQTDGEYMFTANATASFVLTYDTADTFIAKMMHFFSKVSPHPKHHGWALYDVDFEDYSGMCGSAFARLKAISRYLQL